jgi:LysM repeat protein
MILLAAMFFMVPESKVFLPDETHIPGHGTILYKIIGPGDQDFALEEITADVSEAEQYEARSWREGVVVADPATMGGQPTRTDSGIIGTTAGGSALTKPTIIPGATLPGAGTGRTEVVLHDVQPGDVIGAIAERYNVSVATILWANNLTSRSTIRPGDRLKIPPVTGVIHDVKMGDTLSKIAKLYKVDESTIVAFNKLQSGGTDIVVGESLVIPNGVKPQPVTPAPVYRYTALSNIAAPPPSVEAPAGAGYIWPTAARRITQYYGLRHTGVDIGGPLGTAVYAARDGVVTRSSCGWNGGYGCYIVIDHGGGVQTAYGHHAQLFVNVGDPVSQGQTIGAMGSTGRSTGPHLHFEVRVNGRRQNPLRYVR